MRYNDKNIIIKFSAFTFSHRNFHKAKKKGIAQVTSSITNDLKFTK